jgi:Rho-binding antiterminator
MNKHYTPIECGRYSELELAIMHKHFLKVSFLGCGGLMHIETLRPVDLRTRKKGEYLIAVSLGGIHRVLRLDRIHRFEPIPLEA